MEALFWFIKVLWNVESAIFNGMAEAQKEPTGLEGEEPILDTSPMQVVANNPTNEWAWAQGITESLGSTVGRAIGRWGKRRKEGKIPEDMLNL